MTIPQALAELGVEDGDAGTVARRTAAQFAALDDVAESLKLSLAQLSTLSPGDLAHHVKEITGHVVDVKLLPDIVASYAARRSAQPTG